MDVKVTQACKKALSLCNYMLKIQNDNFVKREKNRIILLMKEDADQESAATAREVAEYIKDTFDNVVGEIIVMDIDDLLQQKK